MEPSLEKQLKGHKNVVTALQYSPNEHQIATSSLDHSILLWNFREYSRSYRFQGHDDAVMDVSFSPTGKYMASASRDKTVRLWVPTVTGSTGMFKAHSQTVRSVQFSPDSCKILTASDDKTVKLWASENYKFTASFVGHTNWVRFAHLSNDGSIIASTSDDKTTRLWDPDDGKNIHTYKERNSYGVCLAWHPSGCYIAVGTSHGNVKLYDVRTHRLVQYYSIHNEAVTKVAFHPSGSYILTSSKDGKMKILDLLEGHPIFTLSGHVGSVNTVGFSPSGDSFASAGEDKLVFVWKSNFTESQGDVTENVPQNTNSKTSQATKDKKQGAQTWNQCYHTSKYPISTFVHLDHLLESPNCSNKCDTTQNANCTLNDVLEKRNGKSVSMELLSTLSDDGHPNANSTLLNSNLVRSKKCCKCKTAIAKHLFNSCTDRYPTATNWYLEQNKTCKCENSMNSTLSPFEEDPNTKSTFINGLLESTPKPCKSKKTSTKNFNTSQNYFPHSPLKLSKIIDNKGCATNTNDIPGCSVGHISHIPRVPPDPINITIPSVLNKTFKTCSINHNEESFLGMIALKENDVCYTSGTIEWVGRKRNYPLNSGFKVIKSNSCSVPNLKKFKKSDNNTYTIETEDKKKECECPDVLPTVSAIINHLDALHEAVDIVDLRLNNLESTVSGYQE